MKKVLMVFVAVLIGVTVGWAWQTEPEQEHDQILQQIPIEIKGKLTSGVKLESILPPDLSFAEIQVIRGNHTNESIAVIGSGIGLITIDINGKPNTFIKGLTILRENQFVNLTKPNSTVDRVLGSWGDYTKVWDLSGATKTNLSNIISNSALLIGVISVETTQGIKTGGRITGIWNDGRDAVKGSVKKAK
jgi:hypothetical protein